VQFSIQKRQLMTHPSDLRVLITGISGFTGRHLARHLSEQGWSVFGISNSNMPFEYPTLVSDILDIESVAAWLTEVQPTHIVHLAALSHVVGAALPFYQVNVLGTESFLQALSQASVLPEKIIIASSANVYGKSEGGLLDESSPVHPISHYGISKMSMELVAEQWFEKFPFILTRPFNYTGPGQNEAFLFPKIVGAFRRREPILKLGNLNVARDLSDIRFVVEAYRRLLLSPIASQMINICSGQSISISEALDILTDLTGYKPSIEIDNSFIRKNDIEILTGSPNKLQNAIGPLQIICPRSIFAHMLQASL
jgi:GDP-6-deoxy-D-talose 4-dehydrogenase